MSNRRWVDHDPTVGAGSFKAVTPHDTNILPDGATRGITVTVGGILSAIGDRDDVAVLLPVVAGLTYSYRLKVVKSTGTTATGIIALY
jgi:hypothetical protein